MAGVTSQMGQIKGLEMGRLSWIMWVGPKCHPNFPKREAEEIRMQKRGRQCDHRGRLE